MKRELTPNEVLFNVDLNEGDDNKIRLKDIPEITSAYEKIKRAINDPKRPEPIFLTNGKGAKLKETIENIKNSYYEVAMEFYNTSSESEKDSIIDDVHSKRTTYIGELMEMAKIDGFDVKATNGGFAFIPLKEGEAMTEKEYDELSEENKDSIVLKASNLKKKAEVVLEISSLLL